MPKLVIVESPAKAKTISRFLGQGYDVQASFGHVRDLPETADEIPAAFKKERWAKLGVNTDKNFEPLYIVPSDKKRHVDNLKKAAKGADQLLLATDEDREGESISWHILQLLGLPKGTSVSRVVFHEITPEAISEAVKNPRELDENLVRAQEARRILDRLYGYTLSPLLWKKVAPKLSAGRVQSVAVRLTVLRERERAAFHSATYWDLLALLEAKKGSFKAELETVDSKKLPTGKSFDPTTGKPIDQALLLDESAAGALAEAVRAAKPWIVTEVAATPGKETPPAPFMTSTLQQEANRKLRMSGKRAMQVAQTLYEGVDMGGERVGLITYMRTDSLNLAERALQQAREVIRDLYGAEYLPDKPVRYKTKSKAAQEAHEAIRPTDLARRPQDVAKYLDKDQAALYELIWKRTIACQMLPAQVLRTHVGVSVNADSKTLTFGASGKQITFPGFLRAYVEGSDDPETDLDSREVTLPELKVGDELSLKELTAQSHTTRPPARYTEASLIRKLEEEGIGRPSTYAAIISTIQDRGYVVKRGNELIPTFTAFSVTELLEENFDELVDLAFTSRMENELDEIADGKRDWVKYLRDFFKGEPGHPGLEEQVNVKGADIPFPKIELGVDAESALPVVVRVGRYGTYVQRGEGGPGHTANIPDDLAPADLTLEKALELIHQKAVGPEAVAKDPVSGQCVFYRKGRFGDYLEVDQTPEEKDAGLKPRRLTLPPGAKIGDLEEADIVRLLSLPRSLGKHPDSGQEVIATIGPYGAYVKCGTETRNIADWHDVFSIEMPAAVALLAAPKGGRNRGAASSAPQAPIREFGELEGAAGPVRVLAGRYGPYVTDGKVNATLPKGTDPASVTAEVALQLIQAKAANPSTGRKRFVRRRRSA